jgi:hypothetical protein
MLLEAVMLDSLHLFGSMIQFGILPLIYESKHVKHGKLYYCGSTVVCCEMRVTVPTTDMIFI